MTNLQTQNYINTRNVIMHAIYSAQPIGVAVFEVLAVRGMQRIQLRRTTWGEAEVTRAQLASRGFVVTVEDVS
jgi:hypothetical protein